MSDGTSPASCTGSRATKNAPSAKPVCSDSARPSARRVFPVPPGPVNVTSRWSTEQGLELGDLSLASDEARQRAPQVAARRVERAERREIVGQALDEELMDVLLGARDP